MCRTVGNFSYKTLNMQDGINVQGENFLDYLIPLHCATNSKTIIQEYPVENGIYFKNYWVSHITITVI